MRDSHALLWLGTAESVVDLHPSGWIYSRAWGTSGSQQVSWGRCSGGVHALLWSGTAESHVDLNPAGFWQSSAQGLCGGRQVGFGRDFTTGGALHAILWEGTAESMVDLHSFLPAGYVSSLAYDIDSAGNIVGYARTGTGANHAVLWVPEPSIGAEIDIDPNTLNLASKGRWITCYIWLGEDYNVADIDPKSVLLEYEIQAESLRVDEQQQVATARFNREELRAILNAGEVALTITGQLTDRTVFEGIDVIRVLNKAGKN